MVEKSGGYYHPKDKGEVAELVKLAGEQGVKLRVRGSLHSVIAAVNTGDFETPPDDTRDINVYLDKMTAVSFDDATKQVTVEGGCHFGKDPFDPTETSTLQNSLTYQMQRHGWAFPATGGIIHQTMGGFLSTGSSGGTLKHALSRQIVSLTLINGKGQEKTFARSDDVDDPFFAAAVSMGLLGVLVSVTFQCIDTFNIEGSEITYKYKESPIELFEEDGGNDSSDNPRETLRDFFQDREYCRCMLWPQRGIEKIVMWEAKRTEGPPKLPFPKRYNEFAEVLGSTQPVNIAVGLLMRALSCLNPPGPKGFIAKAINPFLKWLFVLLANQFLVSGRMGAQEFREAWLDGLPMDNRVDYHWTPTEFSEMWVPVEKTQEVMRRIRDHYRAGDLNKVGIYCVEIYPTPSNDYWLSPAYHQDVVKFDMFWFQKNPGRPDEVFYPQFWKLLMPLDCRFHWGKYMPKDPAYMKAHYAKWDDFMALRDEMDPKRIFVTQYWSDRMGIPV